jgi:hypothetical protein
MSDQLPAPKFNSDDYARPADTWVCGWACEGRACKVGPGPHGECRATFECKPVLETKPGETKGRWRCTRSKDQGGACELGPLPDGSCCRPLPRCTPARSLRSMRGRFTLAVCALTVGVLLVLLGGPARFKFINPGPVAQHHTGEAFEDRAREQSKDASSAAAHTNGAHEAGWGCAACHAGALSGPAGWVKAAFSVRPGPFNLNRLATASHTDMTAIDRKCQGCHDGRNKGKAEAIRDHSFHQPNVTRDHSCSACHREHLSAAAMVKPGDAQCRSCHGDGATMQASAAKGRDLLAKNPGAFDYRTHLGTDDFRAPRPTNGYTKVFRSFAEDHPEFQLHAEKLTDGNSLRFNHARHLAKPGPLLNGKPLDCANCHQPDASGAYYRRVNFEQHCRKCHKLQFDPEHPSLQLPHGNESTVKSFLRSLPAQYADYASREKGIRSTNEVAAFVAAQFKRWNDRKLSGDNVEQQVFMSTDRWAPVASVGGSPTLGAAPFPGCASCHEVKESAPEHYEVTRPTVPERWMVRGNFNHAKHTQRNCRECHEVEKSSLTSDINLPHKKLCANCHSPKGGVVHSCSTCHSFHTTHRK